MSRKRTSQSNESTTVTYEVLTQEDPETGDIYLPMPPELLAEMGWVEGDVVDFNQDTQGRWIISKKVE